MATIRLWEHTNQNGQHRDFTNSDATLVNNPFVDFPNPTWNDQASSVEVFSGKWLLYENPFHSTEGGADFLELGPASDGSPGRYNLTDFTQNDGESWNDEVSSLLLL